MEKIHPDLKDSVAETLFIPLAMRALDVRQKRCRKKFTQNFLQLFIRKNRNII